jgi:hypothetical protein
MSVSGQRNLFRLSGVGGRYFHGETDMKKAEELRDCAENCAELAQAATSEPNKKRFERMAEGRKTVADNQAWLDGEDSSAKPLGVDVATR